MNLHKEIKNAYRSIQVSDAMTERLKQELYQKDFHEEDAETFIVEEAPKIPIFKYFGFAVACVAMGIGIGASMFHMLSQRNDNILNPSSTVPVEITVTETTEEPTEPIASVIDPK
ncbi:MAG: hypothetical protein K2K06_00095 [Oscillospiraceae bacterium]|nr:hypothetical protein [Ruminococcus sp.]MDE6706430.1 hypothetical protein [Oscillospiraceae bacterium]